MSKKTLYFIQSIEVETNDVEITKMENLWDESDLFKLLYKQYPFYQIPKGVLSDSPIIAKFGDALICKSIDEYREISTNSNT